MCWIKGGVVGGKDKFLAHLYQVEHQTFREDRRKCFDNLRIRLRSCNSFELRRKTVTSECIPFHSQTNPSKFGIHLKQKLNYPHPTARTLVNAPLTKHIAA